VNRPKWSYERSSWGCLAITDSSSMATSSPEIILIPRCRLHGRNLGKVESGKQGGKTHQIQAFFASLYLPPTLKIVREKRIFSIIIWNA
jgi:hypothetical protein